MSEALNIIKDETLTYNQELLALAKLGENSDHTIQYSDDYYKAKEARRQYALPSALHLSGLRTLI